MRRRRDPDIKPFRGLIEWDSVSRTWIITVRSWEGTALFYLNADDMFDREVLRLHLILANLSPGDVSFQRRDECHVGFTDRVGTTAEAGKLMKILRDHYGHFKGRPIHWMRRPGRPR